MSDAPEPPSTGAGGDRPPTNPTTPTGRVPGQVALPDVGTGERRARRTGRSTRASRTRGTDREGRPAGTAGADGITSAEPASDSQGTASGDRTTSTEPADGTSRTSRTDRTSRTGRTRGAEGARRGGGARSLGFVLTTIVFVGALGGLLAFGWSNLSAIDDDPPPLEATGTSVVPDDPGAAVPPRALLVVEGDDGEVLGVTVLVVGETGAGGRVLFAPAGSMVEVPSFGLNPLREAYELGGITLLEQSAANLLGLVFDRTAVVDRAGLTRLVAPAGTLEVDLPSAVEAVADGGRVETVFPAGPNEIAPGVVPSLLAARGDGSDLDRLVRHQAFWEAWLAAIEGEPGAAPDADAAGGIGAVVAALAAGDVEFDLLPVEVLASGTGVGDDLYAVRGDELDALVAELSPGAAGVEGGRTRVQVLNGTGEPGLAQSVQPVLTPAGAVVSLTGNADRFDYETTQVVFYRDEDLGRARAVQRALGVGEVVRSLVSLDVVDITVVVGSDFRARGAASTPTTSTTTTTDPGA